MATNHDFEITGLPLENSAPQTFAGTHLVPADRPSVRVTIAADGVNLGGEALTSGLAPRFFAPFHGVSEVSDV